MTDVNKTVRHRQDDTDTSARYHHQQQQQQPPPPGDDGAEATVCRKKSTRDRQRRKEKIRYNGACGYYICYSIFVAIVGLLLLFVLLTLHLARCVFVVSDKSVYDCFISLQLGHARHRASMH